MSSVLDQLAAAGLEIVDPLEFGRLVRCRADGDKGAKESGWYVLHQLKLDSGESVVVGRFGNWKRFGGEALKVEFDRSALSAGDRQRLEAEQRRLRDGAAAERQQRTAEAADRARRIWGKLPDSGSSQYLERKHVSAFGVRFSRGAVVVPVRKGADLVGLQFIQADGDKKFLAGSALEGSWHLIGELPTPMADGAHQFRLWIGEGYATCATVHMAMGEPVAVAFNAGNLLPVAKALRALYPQAHIVVVADNDRFTRHPKTGDPWNPGVWCARKAAAAVGANVVMPNFLDEGT